MNHGIISLEYGDIVGDGVWETVCSSGGTLAIFADEVFGSSSGTNDKVWLRSFIRSVGDVQVNAATSHAHKHARFEPLDKQSFYHMCRCCLGNPQWPALVVPTTTTDEQAIDILEDLWERQRALNRRVDQRRPIASILQKRHIPTQWSYLVGFYPETPATIFISGDTALVNEVKRYSIGQSTYEVMEQW